MKKIILLLTIFLFVSGSIYAKQPAINPQKDYRNSFKITFLSWISGSTKISYERAFSSIRQSGEFCTSLIGAGYDKYQNDPKGFTIRYGHKFFMNENQKKSLMGFYLRPEVVYSHYTYNSQYGGERTLSNSTALLGTFGYQYVHKRFLADFWVGGGYAMGTPAETYYHHGFELWHFFNTVNTDIALSFSIRLGYCF